MIKWYSMFRKLPLNHDDTEREFAYQQGAEKALQLAGERNWNVISMKNDWKQVFLIYPGLSG